MRKLLFVSRVALLCNLCFLVTWLLQSIPFIANGIISSTLIIIGHVMSIVINALLVILYTVLALAGRSLRQYVPLWLICFNFIFFIFQAILLVK
jgi:hypothetical protein